MHSYFNKVKGDIILIRNIFNTGSWDNDVKVSADGFKLLFGSYVVNILPLNLYFILMNAIFFFFGRIAILVTIHLLSI